MGEYKPTEIEKELADMLKNIISDKDAYVCTMLMLRVGNPETDPDENCRKLIDFINENPNASEEDIAKKANEIIGIQDAFEGED